MAQLHLINYPKLNSIHLINRLINMVSALFVHTLFFFLNNDVSIYAAMKNEIK